MASFSSRHFHRFPSFFPLLFSGFLLDFLLDPYWTSIGFLVDLKWNFEVKRLSEGYKQLEEALVQTRKEMKRVQGQIGPKEVPYF